MKKCVRLAMVENGIVTNLLEVAETDRYNDPNLHDTSGCDAGIGDEFDGERFWRDGKKLLTREEKLEKELADAKAKLAAMGVSV